MTTKYGSASIAFHIFIPIKDNLLVIILMFDDIRSPCAAAVPGFDFRVFNNDGNESPHNTLGSLGINLPLPPCDNILSGYLCAVTTVFSQQDGIYGLNSSKGFWRSLAEISLF